MEQAEAAMDGLDAAIDEVQAVPVSCGSREEIAAWLWRSQVMRARIEAVCVAAAAAAESAGVASLEPKVRTLRQFAVVRTNGSGVEVACDLKLSQWLSQFPALAEAFRAGRITRRHVEAVRAIDNPRTAKALRFHDSVLAEAGAACSWAGFEEVCERVVVYADPDGLLRDERVRRRGASITTNADGTVSGNFCLEPISGAAIKNALEREAARLADCDEDPSHPEAKVRNHKQRLADAMVNLVTKGVLRPDGTAGAPLVHVVMSQTVLEDAMRRAAADEAGVMAVDERGEPLGDDASIDPADPDQRCSLVDGTPLHPSTVVGLLSVAVLRRIVLGAKGEVLDLGRANRLFPRHLKDALLAAGLGRCGTAGCDAPPAWLQADHIIPWSRGGPTATSNGQIRCAACNKAKRDQVLGGDRGDRVDRVDRAVLDPGPGRDTGDPPDGDGPPEVTGIDDDEAPPDAGAGGSCAA
jgi:hypothetical protein